MNYKITGKVIHGDGYGKALGFPTVNLDTSSNTEALPSCGVYAGVAVLDSVEYKAGIAINNEGKVDAHLIGYSGDAYGKTVILSTKKFLREYKNFESEEELINQIKEDLKLC